MLTSDLVRARVRGETVTPLYVATDDATLLDLAAALAGIFQRHVGRTRGELDRDLKEFLGTATDFLLHRGLAKLLDDRCEFQSDSPADPIALRRAVFDAAATAYRNGSGSVNRSSVFEQVAAHVGLTADQVERALFADLKDEQILRQFEPYTPELLLERYNVALAQAVLFRATGLEIRIFGQTAARHRELLRRIKFFQLMHGITRIDGGIQIRLDGPLSLFQASQKYGLQMANFLPTLLHCDHWELDATLLWGPRRQERRFRLTDEDALKPYTLSQGQWQPPEMAWLPDQFAKVAGDWIIASDPDVLELGGSRQVVIVPDYVFEHRPSGWRVYFEIFGFWRRGAIERRLQQLAEFRCENLLLAVSRELHVEDEELGDLASAVYVFRSVPIAADVRSRLDQLRSARECRTTIQ